MALLHSHANTMGNRAIRFSILPDGEVRERPHACGSCNRRAMRQAHPEGKRDWSRYLLTGPKRLRGQRPAYGRGPPRGTMIVLLSLGFGGRVAVYFGGSVIVGVAMSKLIEVPSLRLRDRWFPALAGGAAATVPGPEVPRPDLVGAEPS